jgi:hypothetical protein
MNDFDDITPRARVFREEDRRPMSVTFDRLIDSNLQLTANVGKLVRVTYGVLGFNAVLVAIVIALLWRHQ